MGEAQLLKQAETLALSYPYLTVKGGITIPNKENSKKWNGFNMMLVVVIEIVGQARPV